MKCFEHGNEAVGICSDCGKPICNECGILFDGKYRCIKCYSKMANGNNSLIPTSRNNRNNKNINYEYNNNQDHPGRRSKTVAGLLALFLGTLGIHKFYLARPIQGVFYILFCWTFIPTIIGFIEGLVYLSMSYDKFDNTYNSRY